MFYLSSNSSAAAVGNVNRYIGIRPQIASSECCSLRNSDTNLTPNPVKSSNPILFRAPFVSHLICVLSLLCIYITTLIGVRQGYDVKFMYSNYLILLFPTL